jgi:RNA polymerase sigma-70 factor (ECF subfamily)
MSIPEEARSTKPADDELQAIVRLRRGDIGGLEVLVRRYQVEALRTAYLICRNRALAEDIAQATFLHLYESIAQFDIARPFGPWFLRCIVNSTLQAMRQQARTRRIGAEEFEQEDSMIGELLADCLPSLDARLDQLDTNEALAAALIQLPPEQRAAVVMRYYLGFSTEEISERQNCTVGTARWRLYRGRERLRRILEPFWRDIRGVHSAGARAHSAEKGEV